MVLSNKKLKQKLRESTSTVSQGDKSVSSSKELLGSAVLHKPRLSKREKRRKISSLQTVQSGGEEVLNPPTNNNNKKRKTDQPETTPSEKKKKRKTGASEKSPSEKPVKKPITKKAKKKKKKKNNNKGKPKPGVAVADQPQPVEINHNQEEDAVADPGTKVYVGGIPYYSTEDDIRSFFESCGTITLLDCMTFPDTGKFRGIAMITFKTEAAAKRALALDGADMGGLFLKIQSYKAARPPKSSDFAPQIVEGYNRVYLGNLSWDITEDDLRNLFSDCKISSIRFGEDKTTEEFRGYAHVDFTDSVSLTIALKLDQQVVCGRPVRIRCAVPKKKVENNIFGSTNKKTAENNIPASTNKKMAENYISGTTNEKISENIISGSTNKTENTSVKPSGGKKRRTCYECGVPGHISSSCPKKQAVGPVSSS